jgi:hypothetical protein
MFYVFLFVVVCFRIIIFIIIGTIALFESRPSSEASASRPYSLQYSSSFSPPTFWHNPSRRHPILVSAYPFAIFIPYYNQDSSCMTLFIQSNDVSCSS